MKNKILKPIISIGFATKGSDSGKVRANVDKNKLDGLNNANRKELISQLDNIVRKIKLAGTVRGLTTAQQEEIEFFIGNQQTLAAIKAYKTFTGIGLKEAKDFIERYAKVLKMNKKNRK